MKNNYEVAVIGGGIQGAGVAQACAAAGYSTVIIEQSDWAAGTSSKSSKLIHGGLRYLETAQISLVWQSLKERNTLLKIAPDLVKPLEFIIPVYKHTKRRPWELRAGLYLYSLLTGLSSLSRFKCIPSNNLLRQKNLQTTFSYWDAQTDDRLLTRAVINSACELGASTLRPVKLISAAKTGTGYQLSIGNQKGPQTIHCQFLINCAGPWINYVMDTISPKPTQQAIDLVKGSHLILNEQISDKAFYLESPIDQRAVFLLPWQGQTLLGTTEGPFNDDPNNVTVSACEIDYLLSTADYYFPNINTTIIDQFAGLRVLPTGTSTAFTRPRECILHQEKSHPRLLSLYGGKLTTYRYTSQQAMKAVKKALGKRKVIANTAKTKLTMP